MNNITKAHIAIFSANLLYGINYLVVKEIVPFHMHPFALSAIRSTGAALLIWLVSVFFKAQKVEKKDFWKLAVAGILGVSINQTLLIAGLSATTSVNASILMTSNPVFVLIIAAIVLKAKITALKVAGIFLGAAGQLLIILSAGEYSLDSQYFTGNILVISNAIMYALYLSWVKPLMLKYNALTVMKWMFLFGSVPVFILGFGHLSQVPFAHLSSMVLLAVAFVIVGSTFLTYMLNIYGLQYVNPTTVSIYIYLQPIIASVLGVIIHHEYFGYKQIIAMILVFVGVYFVNTTNKESLNSENK